MTKTDGYKPKKGDWVKITGAHLINQDYFNRHFPQGQFGKVIDVEQNFSRRTGKKLPVIIRVRIYHHGGRSHRKTSIEYLTLFNHAK